MAGYSAFTPEPRKKVVKKRNEFSQLTSDCKIVEGLHFTLCGEFCETSIFLTPETEDAIKCKCTSRSTQGTSRESYDVTSGAKISG